MSSAQPMEFGHRAEGQQYQSRPGSYAVILGDRNQVAVMHTAQGYFLPGGGADPGESPEATLQREILEECGYAVEIVRQLGFAVEYVFAKGEGFVAKQCTFFLAKLGTRLTQPAEDDHQLVWLSIRVAAKKLAHGSQSWAISNLGNKPADPKRKAKP
jgi:8-oxo-dGTP diphosphatase